MRAQCMTPRQSVNNKTSAKANVRKRRNANRKQRHTQLNCHDANEVDVYIVSDIGVEQWKARSNRWDWGGDDYRRFKREEPPRVI